MPRTAKTGDGKLHPKRGRLQRAASTIARLFRRGEGESEHGYIEEHMESGKHERMTAPAVHGDANTRQARPPHREPDIPFDQIEHAYTPTQTSLKGPFRTSGADRQRDQEFGSGIADDRWNAEDRFTNKSGDPRIGTHGRTYEPGEKRVAASGTGKNE